MFYFGTVKLKVNLIWTHEFNNKFQRWKTNGVKDTPPETQHTKHKKRVLLPCWTTLFCAVCISFVNFVEKRIEMNTKEAEEAKAEHPHLVCL